MIWLEADVSGGLLGDMDGRVKKIQAPQAEGSVGALGKKG